MLIRRARAQLVVVLILFALVAVVLLVVILRNRPEPEPAEPAPAPPAPVLPAPPPADEPPSTAEAVERRENPPILGTIAPFTFTDQAGATLGADDLWGRAWIASFVELPGGEANAPSLSRLAELQQKWQAQPWWSSVRLVSFSVDPERQTPAALAKHAEQLKADAESWKFLAVPREEVERISQQFFRLPIQGAAAEAPPAETTSSRLALIDPQGQVRGHYDARQPASLTLLERDLDLILRERVLFPDAGIIDPRQHAQRRQEQLDTSPTFNVFHGFKFSDQIRASGIRFQPRNVDDAGRRWKAVHYDHGTGISIADVDRDGNYDICFVNQVGGSELWRNLGGGRFENITPASGIGADRIAVAASFADTDNDGDADLFLTTVRGGNLLFENDGSGKFTDITAASGLGYVGHSSCGVFFDYNRDGLLDLFLANVGRYTTEELAPVVGFSRGQPSQQKYYVGFTDAFASHLKPERSEASILYKNLGGNRFSDVSKEAQLQHTAWSGDSTPLDANNDGWTDLYVLSMQGNDEYYENVGGERFVKKSRELFPKTPWGSMGVKVFDYNNDGALDLYITDMHSDMSEHIGPEREKLKADIRWPEDFLKTEGASILGNAFYKNDGAGRFSEISDEIGVENYWPWGPSVGDLNADGFDDIFVASSMNYPYRYGVNTLLLNNQGETFLDSEYILGVEPRRGNRTATPWFELDCQGADREHSQAPKDLQRAVVWGTLGTRSSAMFDLDRDGDLDIVTNDFGSEPMVLISDLSARQRPLHYLQVTLQGVKSNRDGLGAVVKVTSGDRAYTKAYDGKSGYLSQSLYPLYFGLGDSDTADKVEVRWPSGHTQVVAGPIKAGTTIEVKEE